MLIALSSQSISQILRSSACKPKTCLKQEEKMRKYRNLGIGGKFGGKFDIEHGRVTGKSASVKRQIAYSIGYAGGKK